MTESSASQAVRVAIIGYGTVGRATAEIISANWRRIEERSGVRLTVTAVCRRTPVEAADVPPGVRVVADWRELVHAEDIDIVVETIGGRGVAREVVCASLENGKPVVTANKELMAEDGDELFALARKQNLPIGFEATVAGGVPVVRAISEAMTGDSLRAVYGILNGTANYILTRMESGAVGFDKALAEAQHAGYAEADPTMDVQGFDSRFKLCLLARLAFHGRLLPAAIACDGIAHIEAIDFHYARRLQSTIRLVGAAEQNENGIDISVRPWLVKRNSMLAKVEDVNNAVFLIGEKVGTQMFFGPGAGGGATGAAIVSDLVEIARDFSAGHLRAKKVSGFEDGEDLRISQAPRALPWYLRLTVKDQPGILARVADVIAAAAINIDSVVQEPGMAKDRLSFVVTTEPVSEPALRTTIAAINQFPFMLQPVLLLRME